MNDTSSSFITLRYNEQMNNNEKEKTGSEERGRHLNGVDPKHSLRLYDNCTKTQTKLSFTLQGVCVCCIIHCDIQHMMMMRQLSAAC